MNKEEIEKIIDERLEQLIKSDRYVFHKTIQILDGRKIIVGTSNGSSIGSETTQKLSVYGETPVVQAAAITAPTGGVTQDAEARTKIGELITALHNFGIIG